MIEPGIPDDVLKQQEQADSDLLTAIQERESSSFGNDADPSTNDRAKQIDYYLGEPFGNELPDRSQVVSRDVSDTIEWIKPSLMRIFTGGDQVCRFDPVGEEDVEAAAQESDYVDFVIQKKNPWFQIAYEWFTDALLTRNAYAMAYWEEKQDAVLERYKGLLEDQLAMIAMDQSVQIIAHQSYPAPIGSTVALLHDVDVRRLKNYGCVKIVVLPPERCLVAQETRSVCVRDAAFFEYWEYKTLSALRADGFDVPDDIADTGGNAMDRTLIDQSRDVTDSATLLGEHTTRVDPAMRRVKVRSVWIKHDYNGDGIAEHRYCVVVGDTFLVNEECTGVPVACIVPTPMPHRHTGQCISDAVMDLQEIKSMMLRQVVDNTYLANNGRTAVDKNLVNLDDMMVSRPGGVVRVNGAPSAAIMPFVHPQTAAQGIQVIEYLDQVRQNRTGTSQYFTGVDANALNKTASGISQLTTAAAQRVELIARVFAEGVKDLFQIVHEITLSNATAADKVQLRGQWVTVDPRQWRKRHDMTIAVGLGVGNRDQQLVHAQMILALQREALPHGLTTYHKIYNTLTEITKAAGFAAGDRFWQEPDPNAQFQSQPPYQVQVAQINAQSDAVVQNMKNHATATVEQLKKEAEALMTVFKEQQENMRVQYEGALRAYSEATDRMHEARIANASKPAQTSVKITGLESIAGTVKESADAAKEAANHAKAASESVAKASAERGKKKKRTIKSSSGKTYTVEEE